LRISFGGIEQDRKKAMKIIKLIREIRCNSYSGTGDPEQLKHELVDCWSRRIDTEHRLVYQVLEKEDKIRILACRYHYSKH
jgi:toxin YoeB